MRDLEATLTFRRLSRWLLAAVVLPALGAGSAGAATWTVGPDPDTCDFVYLDAAFAAAGDGDTVLLSVGTYWEEQDGVNSGDLVIYEKSLEVIGGHSHCGGPVVGTSTLKSVPRSHGALVVHAFDDHHHVRLVNLVIADGSYDKVHYLHFNDGGLTVKGNLTVEAENLSIEGNEAVRGGGLDLYSLQYGGVRHRPHVMLSNSRIYGNTAEGMGGGIRCDDATLTLRDVEVAWNTSGEEGGGVYLEECFLTVERGLGKRVVGVNDNFAGGDGGGLWAGVDSVVFYQHGQASSVVFEVANNISLGAGGGALVQDSLLLASALELRDNFAITEGGALAATDGSYVSIGETLSSCGKAGGCNVFSGNYAGQRGGALHVVESTASLLATRATANGAGSGGGFAFAGEGARLRLSSLALDAHGGANVIETLHAEELDVRSLTFLDNLPRTSVLRVKDTAEAIVSQSIFHDNGVDYLKGDPVVFTCNVIDGFFPEPAGGVQTAFGDPIFAGAGDFHLSPFSPFSGLCGADTPHARVDLGYQPRPSGAGFEPGADEL